MTYGALVVQLVQDYEDYAAVNAALARMGASIGQRLVEDFLARSALGRCADFKETGEVVAKVRFYFYFCSLYAWAWASLACTLSKQTFSKRYPTLLVKPLTDYSALSSTNAHRSRSSPSST